MTKSANATVTTPLPGGPLRARLLGQVAAALAGVGRPKLAVVLIGNDPASEAYVARKLAACAEVGIGGELARLAADAGEAALAAKLKEMGGDPAVTAIIVQLALPAGWVVEAALGLVPRLKDCDGLGLENRALRLAGDRTAIAPATPLGVMRLLESIGFDVKGKAAAVIGKGRVAGQPMREMLAAAGAEVASIDKDTPNPQALARRADLLVSAAGVPGLVGKDWVKPGAVVVDIGLTREDDGGATKLKGDVDEAAVEGVAGALTPVPGGVGPLTVASLITNVVDCARLQAGLDKWDWRVKV